MTVPESTLRDVSGDQVLPQASSRQSWPRFHATLERLKAHPIGQCAKPAPKIDLEQHADYFESK